MTRWTLIAAAILALGSSSAVAQEGPSPAAVERAALVALAEAPDDVRALLALARARAEAGDWQGARAPALRAHALARGEEWAQGRALAARIVALGHAREGRWTRATWWLRRAIGDAQGEEARATLARDLREVRARNPLEVRLSFGVAPSTNVNGGTSADTIWLPIFGPEPLPFEPVGDALPLAGLRISGGVQLSWRLRAGERSGTFLEGGLSGRTYVLGEEAREIAPGAEGSDYAEATVNVGVVHRWRGEGASGPSALRFGVARGWYGGEPLSRTATLGYERGFAIGERDRLDLGATADWTLREQEDEELSYASLGVRGRWTRGFDAGQGFVSLGLRDTREEIADVTFRGATLGMGWSWAEPVGPVRLGVGLDLEVRDYDLSVFAPAGRRDQRASLRVTAGVPDWEVWGFEPTVTVEAGRTWSDSDRSDSETVTVDLGFRSTF